MTGAKFGLDNLTAIVDRNFIQIDGSTEDVMPLEPLADKYRAFNWEVLECDGNDSPRSSKRPSARRRNRQAASDHRAHGSRQGRFVHGRRLYVARQAAQRAAGRTGVARARAEREGISPMLAERTFRRRGRRDAPGRLSQRRAQASPDA